MNKIIDNVMEKTRYPTDARKFWLQNEEENKSLNEFINQVSDFYGLVYKLDFSYRLEEERNIKKQELVDRLRGQRHVHAKEEIDNILEEASEHLKKAHDIEQNMNKYDFLRLEYHKIDSLKKLEESLKNEQNTKNKKQRIYDRIVKIRESLKEGAEKFHEVEKIMNDGDKEKYYDKNADIKDKFYFFDGKYAEFKKKNEPYQNANVTSSELRIKLSEAINSSKKAIDVMKKHNEELQKELQGVKKEEEQVIKGWQNELKNLRGEKSTPSK